MEDTKEKNNQKNNSVERDPSFLERKIGWVVLATLELDGEGNMGRKQLEPEDELEQRFVNVDGRLDHGRGASVALVRLVRFGRDVGRAAAQRLA